MHSELTAVELEVLRLGFAARPVSPLLTGVIERLAGMGFVFGYEVVGATAVRVILTPEGNGLARMHREWRRWELWRDLYSHLQQRAALETDPDVRRRLFGRSQSALQRATAALCRVAPDIAAKVVGRRVN